MEAPGRIDRATDHGIALLRLALVPIALAVLPARSADLTTDVYPYLVAVLAIYAVVVFALTRARATRPPSSALQAAIDLVLISGLVYSSGGLDSPLRVSFYVLPVVAALRLSPRLTAAWIAVAVVAYAVVTVPHPGTDLDIDGRLILEESLTLAWAGAAALLLSWVVGRRTTAAAALAASRRQLVQQLLTVEAQERTRLAQVLHDDAIQTLLVARQEVAEMADGVEGAGERAQSALDETLRQLRAEVFAMHPVGLELVGVEAVLQSLADSAGRRGRFTTELTVDPAVADLRSDLLASVARELLTNAAKHANAAHVSVGVQRTGPDVVLTVVDDGVGIDAGRTGEALAAGHIGLASISERLEAVGGSLRLESAAGGGTQITATFPAPQP